MKILGWGLPYQYNFRLMMRHYLDEDSAGVSAQCSTLNEIELQMVTLSPSAIINKMYMLLGIRLSESVGSIALYTNSVVGGWLKILSPLYASTPLSIFILLPIPPQNNLIYWVLYNDCHGSSYH